MHGVHKRPGAGVESISGVSMAGSKNIPSPSAANRSRGSSSSMSGRRFRDFGHDVAMLFPATDGTKRRVRDGSGLCGPSSYYVGRNPPLLDHHRKKQLSSANIFDNVLPPVGATLCANVGETRRLVQRAADAAANDRRTGYTWETWAAYCQLNGLGHHGHPFKRR